jgi:UDP-N-acetylglucosamine diphosphorylase/glucosamine-1-phosphate N-acetyltransferase
MRYVLFDDDKRENLLPLAYTRPISEFRIGILTIREKWSKQLGDGYEFVGVKTEDYLQHKYQIDESNVQLWINSSVCPNKEIISEIKSLRSNHGLYSDDGSVIAFKANSFHQLLECVRVKVISDFIQIKQLWDLFSKNGSELESDYKLFTKGRVSQTLNDTNTVIAPENVFIEEGAIVNAAIINASLGPVYIGANAQVMEGSIIRGPFALCKYSQTKLGAKIYGPTTIGPYSKVGGELNNVVIFGYSNKGHDGFLGNSVLGEWCNIGADSNNSNLKNNYAEVKLWNYTTERFTSTGLQFCGLIMGDHSKCGINTMFNTGTVVGVSANIFGAGFPRNFIPSFSWGGPKGQSTFQISKAIETTEKVMERRQIHLNDIDKSILTKVFELSEKYRR